MTWEELAELGWHAAAIEERFGGAGGGVGTLTTILTEAGRTLLDAPLLSTAGLASAFLTSAETSVALERIVGGEAATLAFHGLADRSLAPGDGVAIDGSVVKGTRARVTDARTAAMFVVPLLDDGHAFVAVMPAGEAANVTTSGGPDPNRPLSTVVFDGRAMCVGRLETGLFTRSLAMALTALAAELVGLADGALDAAISHARNRVQFGVPIGTFQSVGHRLVDGYALAEKARSLLIAAVDVLSTTEIAADDCLRIATLAKAAASEAALTAAGTSVQVHAAASLTKGHQALRYLLRAQQTASLLGDPTLLFRSVGNDAARQLDLATAGRPRRNSLVAEYSNWLHERVPQDNETRCVAHRFDPQLRARYQREAFESGWLLPDWPVGKGGRGLDQKTSLELRVESATRGAPKLCCMQAVGVVAPVLRDYGSVEQQRDYLVPTLRGDLWWAIGMSEPDAGSDLAALRTQATRGSEGFRVRGQKTWTTQAGESAMCLLFVKTDLTAPRHSGISCLLIDMKAPGITVRPIEMAWDTDEVFCDVYFDDVVVPASGLLGNEGDGWRIAVSALRHERDMIWLMNLSDTLRALRLTCRSLSAHPDQSLAVELGRRIGDIRALMALGLRVAAKEESGATAKEGYLLKLISSETLQRAWNLATLVTSVEADDDRELWFDYVDSRAATLYGGTSEIQRDIVARRALELPRRG